MLVVGTLSLTDRAAFPDATVWSGYGRGYGFVPLVLPVLGLLWLRHKALEGPADEPAGDPAGTEPPTPRLSAPVGRSGKPLARTGERCRTRPESCR